MSQFDRYAALIDRHLSETGQMPTQGGETVVSQPKILPWPAVIPMPPALYKMFTNQMHGRGRTKTNQYREWIKQAVAILESYRRPLLYPVECSYVVRDKLRANADVENRVKALTDSLVTAGVLQDDKVKFVRKVSIEYQPGGTGVEVWIREAF